MRIIEMPKKLERSSIILDSGLKISRWIRMQNISENGGTKILGGKGKCTENPNRDPDLRLTGDRESVT